MCRTRKMLTMVSFVILTGFGWIESSSAQTSGFQQTLVTGGLSAPTAMEFAPDGRLFVAQQSGRLRVIGNNGVLLPTDFVTLSATEATVSEDSWALHSIRLSPRTVLCTLITRAQPLLRSRTGSAGSPRVRRILTWQCSRIGKSSFLTTLLRTAGNHNGGAIHFGLDGMFCTWQPATAVSTPPGTPRRSSTLSGKLLRIDPDGGIPPDNPFVGTVDARGEIWAPGLRNPYTFAVDPLTGTIHINDVGQAIWEEVNLGARGANYGWPDL